MADIFFYTDPMSISQQLNDPSTGEAFGPISSSKYQITCRHKANSSAKAISVFSGTIVAVDTGTFLTLILRPEKDIKELTKLDLPSLKYIIYKGIKRESLIDADPTKIAPPGTNDLTQAIWDTQDANNIGFSTAFDPGIEVLRLDEVLAPDESIDKLFEGYIGSSFEPQRVSAGDYIGDFADGVSDLFGVEFVFDELRSKTTFSECQDQNFKIDTSSISGYARIKNAKERILNFIDPTAFYGSLYPVSEGILAYKNNAGLIIDYKGPKNPGGALSLYQLILTKLYTRNRIYFDIRNEYGRSFNNLGVYADSVKLKLGKNQSDFIETNYYTYFNEWPILGIESNISGISLYDPDDNSNKSVEIGLKLPIGGVLFDNTQPLILLYHNYFKFRFGSKKTKSLKPKETFVNPLIDTGDPGYFEELTFELPNDESDALTNGVTSPVSTYIRLKFFRELSRLSASSTIHRQENYIDSLIIPFENTPKYNSGLEIRTFKEDLYMGTDVDISIIPEEDRDGNNPETNYVSSVGYAYDLFNVTFFTFANRKRDNSERKLIKISPIQYFAEGSFLETLGELNKIGGSDSLVKTIIDIPVPGFPDQRQELYRFLKPPVYQSDAADFSTEFSAIVISKNTYTSISNALTSGTTGLNTEYDVHLVLRNRQNNLTSIVNEVSPGVWENTGEKLANSVYELWLRGFVEVGTGVNQTLSALEWNTGIILMSEKLSASPIKNFIIVEQGTNFPNLKRDTELPCFKNTLSVLEKGDLEALIDYIDGPPGSSFKPNNDLHKRVFRTFADPNPGQEEQNYTFEIEPVSGTNPLEYEVFFRDSNGSSLTEMPNDQVKGFILEAATVFAIYNLLLDLLKPSSDNYIYQRMIKVLIKNGLKPNELEVSNIETAIKARLFNPFLFFGMWYGKNPDNRIDFYGNPITINDNYKPDDFYTFQPFDISNVRVNSISTIGEMFTYLKNTSSPTSFKEEVFNLIRSGNFHPIQTAQPGIHLNPAPLSNEPVLFDLPDSITKRALLFPPSGGSGVIINNILDQQVKDYIEPLVGKIVREVNEEFKFLINKKSKCFYRVFTKNLNYNDSFEPEARLLATGDGSSTKGLLNMSGGRTLRGANYYMSKPISLGPYVFTYNLDKDGNAQGHYTETFPTITKETSVAVHFSIYGMDPGLTPDIMEVELNGPYVGGPTGNKLLMRFVGEQDFPDNKKKLFPENSLLGSGGAIPPHLLFPSSSTLQREERVNLETFGTSLLLTSGSSSHPDIVDSDFAFLDSSGNIGGFYLSKWNNLIINKKPPYSITVRVFSGQAESSLGSKVPVHKDVLSFEEMQLAVNIAETIPSSVRHLKLPAQNIYPDDKFELTSAQKKDLIINEEKFPDAIDAYKQLAQLIYNSVDPNPNNGGISSSNMFFNLSGNYVGRPKQEVSTSFSLHQVCRDTRFTFDKPRPATLGWTEIVPSATTVGLPLDEYLFHPNDTNKDLTRLLEVPAWLPVPYNAKLRFSFGSATVVFTNNNEGSVFFSIESFVSPIWSRLDEKIQNDYRHVGSGTVEGLTQAQRLGLINSFTLYGDGTGGSDAYIKLGASNFIPSYNPVLSCLRSFGLMEAIRDNIAFMVNDSTYGLGIADPSAGEAVRNEIQSAIDNIVISADPFLGFTQNITYDLYKKLKWYYSTADKALYGNTI